LNQPWKINNLRTLNKNSFTKGISALRTKIIVSQTKNNLTKHYNNSRTIFKRWWKILKSPIHIFLLRLQLREDFFKFYLFLTLMIGSLLCNLFAIHKCLLKIKEKMVLKMLKEKLILKSMRKNKVIKKIIRIRKKKY